MKEKELNFRVILSISSDIGTELALSWIDKGFNVVGTYRNWGVNCDKLEMIGVKLIECDLNDKNSIDQALEKFLLMEKWDVLTIASGAQEPIGNFLELNFDDWEDSLIVNFSAQLRFLRGMLPHRKIGTELMPIVLFFAGGGTNNATVNYSAYTISKIASIKMCELLDAEIHDTRFTILGPGWVKTKIHEATLQSGTKAGDNFQKTIEMLDGDKCFPISEVVECCNWLVNTERKVISGRNFSAVHDDWKNKEINSLLLSDMNIYKLRRFGN